MKKARKPFTAIISLMLLFSACKKEIGETETKQTTFGGTEEKVQRKPNAVAGSETNLFYVPRITVQLTGANKITNGTSATYTATVSYTDTRPLGVQVGDHAFDPLNGTLKVTAPGNITVLTTQLNNIALPPSWSKNRTTTRSVTFTLNCAPPGRAGTLRTSDGRDTRSGSRICNSQTIMTNPGTPPCPSGCKSWFFGCPPGCGQPPTYKTVVVCTDNAARVYATFTARTREYYSGMDILCIPSEGPTEGTL